MNGGFGLVPVDDLKLGPVTTTLSSGLLTAFAGRLFLVTLEIGVASAVGQHWTCGRQVGIFMVSRSIIYLYTTLSTCAAPSRGLPAIDHFESYAKPTCNGKSKVIVSKYRWLSPKISSETRRDAGIPRRIGNGGSSAGFFSGEQDEGTLPRE